MRTEREAANLELWVLADAVLKGEIPDLEDLRSIESLRLRTGHGDDPVFFSIRSAVSDLDAVPSMSRRTLYSPAFLAESDAMCAAYLRDAAVDIKASCRALLSSSWL